MPQKKPRIDHEPLDLGPLPVEAINNTLDLDLEPGEAVLPAIISTHVLRNHPDDYRFCLPHVASVLGNPLFAGDDFRNSGKIELIARVPAINSPMLVAVEITKNEAGKYEVRSFYPIKEEKVQNRLRKGFLKRVQTR